MPGKVCIMQSSHATACLLKYIFCLALPLYWPEPVEQVPDQHK